MNENNDEESDPGAYCRLAGFLRSLADRIDQKTLTQEQLQRVGEFFMSYQFQEQAIKDDENMGEEGDEESQGEVTREDLIKFLSIGWYVYCILLSDRTLPP